MSELNLYSFEEISNTVDVSDVTVLYWINRFKKWIQGTGKGKTGKYTKKAVDTIELISKLSKEGMDSNKIEDYLEDNLQLPDGNKKNNKDLTVLPLSNDKTDPVMREYFQILSSQQERIANAQEKRADAEMEKVVALEKRAEAEMKKAVALEKRAEAETRKAAALEKKAEVELIKAQALSDLTATLKEQDFGNILNSVLNANTLPQQPAPPDIAIDKATDNDLHDNNLDLPNKEEDKEKNIEEDKEQEQKRETENNEHDGTSDIDSTDLSELNTIDDLSLLLDPQQNKKDQADNIDDLSQLLNPTETTSDSVDLDDLSQLLDTRDKPSGSDDLDDLSALVDNNDIDDLSSLVDNNDVDDLSSLVDNNDVDDLSSLVDNNDVDDLSSLVDNNDIDDLSSLVDNNDVDDLSSLVDNKKSATKSTAKPKPVPKASPSADTKKAKKIKAPKNESFEEYKKRILNMIIDLKKNKKKSVEETTKILNDKGLKPLSGKGVWTKSIISKIYNFIDPAKK